jgi:thiol-disulfide isomerase/thioredoxin
MKQQCHISMIYLSWALYLGGIVALLCYSAWALLALWLVIVPAVHWLYLRKFPSISTIMGYGPIADRDASAFLPAPVEVTLYTALGCPFCPLIEQRLDQLQQSMNFSLRKVDVTLRPDLLASKGIRSVPVVEVHGRFLTGLISTRDLVEALTQPVAQALAPAR